MAYFLEKMLSTTLLLSNFENNFLYGRNHEINFLFKKAFFKRLRLVAPKNWRDTLFLTRHFVFKQIKIFEEYILILKIGNKRVEDYVFPEK